MCRQPASTLSLPRKWASRRGLRHTCTSARVITRRGLRRCHLLDLALVAKHNAMKAPLAQTCEQHGVCGCPALKSQLDTWCDGGWQVVAFQATMELMAEQFPGAFAGYRLQVVESHQRSKVDTSGTARAIVQSFQKLGLDFEEVRCISHDACSAPVWLKSRSSSCAAQSSTAGRHIQ